METRNKRSVSGILKQKKAIKEKKLEEEHKLKQLKQEYDVDHKKHWINRLNASRKNKLIVLSILGVIFTISSIFLVEINSYFMLIDFDNFNCFFESKILYEK